MKPSFKTIALGLFITANFPNSVSAAYSCGYPNNPDEDHSCSTCKGNDEEASPGAGGAEDDNHGGQGGGGAPMEPEPSKPSSSAARSPDTRQSFVLPNGSDGRNSALDLRVFNSVGRLPLELRRYYKTRSRSGLGDPFGQSQTWSHSYSWGIFPSGSGKRSVAVPGGRTIEFTQSGTTTYQGATVILHVPQSGRGERLYQFGTGDNTFVFLSPDGTRQVFERVTQSGGGVLYFPRYGEDSGGRRHTYTTDAKARITQVTDAAGNYITLQYGGIQINRKEAVVLKEVTTMPSTGWNQYVITNPTAFRWLQCGSSPTSYFNISEIEFYGPGPGGTEVKLSGTVFGVGPSHNQAQSETFDKAFDGNTATGYVHNSRSGGISGIDLGSGNTSTVTKIRFKPRTSGALAQGMASLKGTTFEGLQENPQMIEVLQRVETSDGRAVNYIYDTFNDPSIDQNYLVLSGVDYGDDGVITAGDDATFTHTINDQGRAPNVSVFYEPRSDGGVPHLEFRYHNTRFATRGQVSKVLEAGSGEVILDFDANTLRQVKFPGARNISIAYNTGNGTPLTVTDASGQAWAGEWNATSNFMSKKTDPAGREIAFDFNHRGLRTSIVRPDGLTETSTYDAEGLHLLTHTRSAAGHPSRTIGWVRDSNGRITRINFPDTSYVTYTYNSLGLLTQKRERNGSLTDFEYTGPAGLVTFVILASGTADEEQWGYTYHAPGNASGSPARMLASVTDPRGRTTAFEYNLRGQLTKTTYPDASSRTYGYDFVGNKNSESDGTHSLAWTYNGFRKTTSMTDPLGHVTEYRYGVGGIVCNCFNAGGPTLVVSPEGRQTLREYDEQWRLKKETIGYGTAAAATTESLYDMVGNLSIVTEPGGVTRSYSHDVRNRVLSEAVAGPDGRGGSLSLATTRAYDPFGNVISMIRPGSRTTSMTYDVMERTATVTDPLGTVTKPAYDAAGNRISVTEDFGGPLARTTATSYDLRNRPRVTTFPDSTTNSVTYHPGGAIHTRTDELNRTTYTDDALTTWSDSKGNTWQSFVSTYQDALNHVSSSHPKPMGRFAGTTMSVSPMGRVGETYHSPDGTVSETRQGLVASGSTLAADLTVTTFAYDDDHLLLSQSTDPTGLNLTTAFTYDSRGNRLTVTDPLGRVTETQYSLRGNPVKTILPDTREHLATFDALDRRATSTDPKSQTLTITHWYETGSTLTLKDAKNQTTTWTYNQRGQILTKTYPNGDDHAYTYDSLARMETHTTPKSETCTYSYDLRDRTTKRDWSSTTPDTDTTYFDDGTVNSIDNGATLVEYTYNARREMTSEKQTFTGRPARTVGYAYDADGLRSDLTYPGTQAVDYTWTARARLHQLSADGPPPLATYAYDKADRLDTLTHENGIIEDFTYDAASQLQSRLHKFGGTTVSGHDYDYDSTGRRTDETFPGTSTAARSYAYDTADQIDTVDYGGGLTDDYNFDAAGNRSTVTAAALGGTAKTYNADSANQYTGITGQSAPTFDDNGNQLTNGRGVTQTWDSENRLLSVAPTTPAVGDKSLGYIYDGHHRRVIRSIHEWNGSVWSHVESTRFIHDGWNVIEEYTLTTTTETLAKELTWGTDLSGSLQGAGGVGGLLLATDHGTAVTSHHYQYDGNGNVTEITDHTGASEAIYRYDAFGNTLVATGTYAPTNRYRFSTKPLDNEVANAPLYYYGYRYYDPVTGRWPSRDPIGETGGINLYGFVGNDGVNGLDILGLNALNVSKGTLTKAPTPCSELKLGKADKLPCCKIKTQTAQYYRERGDFGVGSGDFINTIESGDTIEEGSHNKRSLELVHQAIYQKEYDYPVRHIVYGSLFDDEGKGFVWGAQQAGMWRETDVGNMYFSELMKHIRENRKKKWNIQILVKVDGVICSCEEFSVKTGVNTSRKIKPGYKEEGNFFLGGM